MSRDNTVLYTILQLNPDYKEYMCSSIPDTYKIVDIIVPTPATRWGFTIVTTFFDKETGRFYNIDSIRKRMPKRFTMRNITAWKERDEKKIIVGKYFLYIRFHQLLTYARYRMYIRIRKHKKMWNMLRNIKYRGIKQILKLKSV